MIIHLQTTITQETLQSTTIQNVQTHDLDVATLNSSYVTQIIVIHGQGHRRQGGGAPPGGGG